MYTPKDDDFEFLKDRDLSVDENFAAQGYWKGVAVHFARNRLAVAGTVIICLVIAFAVLAPVVSPYSYDEIVSIQTTDGRQVIAKNLEPQLGAPAQVDDKRRNDRDDRYQRISQDVPPHEFKAVKPLRLRKLDVIAVHDFNHFVASEPCHRRN